VADGRRIHEIERELARTNPALLAAADEVDSTLIDWALGLGPFERLDACSRAARALAGWRRVAPAASSDR
jgi:hypothetical protein